MPELVYLPLVVVMRKVPLSVVVDVVVGVAAGADVGAAVVSGAAVDVVVAVAVAAAEDVGDGVASVAGVAVVVSSGTAAGEAVVAADSVSRDPSVASVDTSPVVAFRPVHAARANRAMARKMIITDNFFMLRSLLVVMMTFYGENLKIN